MLTNFKQHAFYIAFCIGTIICINGCAINSTEFAPGEKLTGYQGKYIAISPNYHPYFTGLKWTVLLAGELHYNITGEVESYLSNALLKTQKLRLIERTRLESVLKEHELSLSGATDTETAKEIGKILGIDGIIFLDAYPMVSSWVFPFQWDVASCNARLVDIETGEIVFLGKSSFKSFSILPIIPFWQNPSKSMANKIASKLNDYYKNKENN